MSLVSCWSGNEFPSFELFNAFASGWVYTGTSATRYTTRVVNGRTFIGTTSSGSNLERDVAIKGTSTGMEIQLNVYCGDTSSQDMFDIFNGISSTINGIVKISRNTSAIRYSFNGNGFTSILSYAAGDIFRFTIRIAPAPGGGVLNELWFGGNRIFFVEDNTASIDGFNGTDGLHKIQIDEGANNLFNDVLVWDELTGPIGTPPRVYEVTDRMYDPSNTTISQGSGTVADITDSSLITTSVSLGSGSFIEGSLLNSPTFTADAIVFSGNHATVSVGNSNTLLEIIDSTGTVIESAVVNAPENTPLMGALGIVELPSVTSIAGDTTYKLTTP